MNFKRIGRSLICLLLVCVLLLNVSPIRAEASVLGGIVTVETAKAVGSMLLGLGIGVGATATAFELLTSNAASELGLSDTMSIYSFGDGRFGVEGSRLQRLFDWLFDSGTLEANYADTSSYWTISWNGRDEEIVSNAPCSIVLFTGTYGKYNTNIYALYAFGADLKLVNWKGSDVDGVSTIRVTSGVSEKPAVSGCPVLDIGHYADTASFYKACASHGTSDLDSITSPYDVTLNFIAEPGISLATGYPAWHQNAVSIPNVETGENEVYYPIVIGGTLEETQNKTQEEVWTGEGSVVDSPPTTEPDVGIDTEGLTQAGRDASLSLFGYELGAKLGAWFEEQFGLISALTVIVEGIYELIKPIADWFSTIISGIGDILETLVAGIPAIIDAITAIPAAIADVITDALVWAFAPSETFIASKVDALIAKYPSSQNLFTLGDQLKSFFLSLGQTPPVINIDLGAFEGSFYLGGTVAFLDLTWYSRYKPTMDAILGGFLWLWFAWRMWLKLPGILEGASGEVGRLIVRRESNNDN